MGYTIDWCKIFSINKYVKMFKCQLLKWLDYILIFDSFEDFSMANGFKKIQRISRITPLKLVTKLQVQVATVFSILSQNEPNMNSNKKWTLKKKEPPPCQFWPQKNVPRNKNTPSSTWGCFVEGDLRDDHGIFRGMMLDGLRKVAGNGAAHNLKSHAMSNGSALNVDMAWTTKCWLVHDKILTFHGVFRSLLKWWKNLGRRTCFWHFIEGLIYLPTFCLYRKNGPFCVVKTM